MAGSQRISPTAYATGYFWYKNGLSPAVFATRRGQYLYRAFWPSLKAVRLVGGLSTNAMLLARHQGIDAFLDGAIAAGRVSQVIELAAGLSPRGWRFAQRYGQRIRYLETDLPAMVATKRKMLQTTGSLGANHQLVTLDALATSGPDSLEAIAGTLDPQAGTAIITEGLVNYLDPQQVSALWQRIARTLGSFHYGLYLNDVYYSNIQNNPVAKVFRQALSGFVRGRLYLHFDDSNHARNVMRGHGFATVNLRQAITLEANSGLADPLGAKAVYVMAATV